MDIDSLKNKIKKFSKTLGLPLVGFTNLQKPPHGNFFTDWINNGYHGEMEYLSHTLLKRTNPKTFVPWAKSVIVFGMPYGQKNRPGSDGIHCARYSVLKDYHKTLYKKIKRVANLLHEWNQKTKTKVYVDTGPVLERDFAMLAGLGWIGKNTNLISWKLGSYFLLGILFTDIEFPPDKPVINHFCGNCTKCIDACPTGAIIAPWTLDARRCISYLTIENRGSIPLELRKKMGNWFFGCDICQEVCPWNKNPITVPQEINLLNPKEVLNSDEESFMRITTGTVFKRPKRRGMLRNYCVALGNLGGERSRDILREIIEKERDPLIREHADWAIKQISR